jgi:hypothetical protein
MHRKALIAFAVGSILGGTLPQAYADQQPAAAPSQTNAQQAATTTNRDQGDIKATSRRTVKILRETSRTFGQTTKTSRLTTKTSKQTARIFRQTAKILRGIGQIFEPISAICVTTKLSGVTA